MWFFCGQVVVDWVGKVDCWTVGFWVGFFAGVGGLFSGEVKTGRIEKARTDGSSVFLPPFAR